MVEITPEVIAAFRVAHPAFTDEALWPDNIVEAALAEGDAETAGRRWGAFQLDNRNNRKLRGMFYYAAHLLTVEYPRGGTGTISGTTGKIVASKSVGDESYSFVTRSYSDYALGDEFFSTTIYGQQFLRLRRRVGMGALAV